MSQAQVAPTTLVSSTISTVAANPKVSSVVTYATSSYSSIKALLPVQVVTLLASAETYVPALLTTAVTTLDTKADDLYQYGKKKVNNKKRTY